VTDGAPGGSGSGLRGAVARLGASLLALLRTRLELVALELDEERERIGERLVLILVAMLFLAFAVFGATTFVVAWFWDTHRFVTLGAVTLVYVAIACVALWQLRQRRRHAPPPASDRASAT
jgi:uncharacterized membrane protein YqjE